MQTIKVTYQSSKRRFSIPSTMTWLNLESNLREMFSLPLSFKFSLSYTDEEGDVITLSTDIELQELLSSQSPQSVLKFTLIPDKQKPSNASTKKEKFIPADTNVSEKIDNNVTPPFKSLSVSKEEPAAETSTSAANEQQQVKSNAELDELAKQFQELLDQFKDVLSRNPQLVEQTNEVMKQILTNIQIDINQWAELLNTFKAQEGNSREERHEFGQFLSSFPSTHALLSSPLIQQLYNTLKNSQDLLQGLMDHGGKQQREELSQETLKEEN